MLGRNGRLKTKAGPSREFGLRPQYCGHHAIELPSPGSHRTDSRCEKVEPAWRAVPRRPARVTTLRQLLGNPQLRSPASVTLASRVRRSAAHFARCYQLTRGLPPPSRCPYRAHNEKTRQSGTTAVRTPFARIRSRYSLCDRAVLDRAVSGSRPRRDNFRAGRTLRYARVPRATSRT
jgi:hypothetical protein